MSNKFDCLHQLLSSFDKTHRKQSTLLVGIDGCGGSGKSTLAKELQHAYDNVTIVHMDDFFLPSNQRVDAPPKQKPIGADFDWKRLFNQVLEPVSQDKEGRYQRYDWEMDNLAEWHIVPIGGIVIVEGVYSLRREISYKYDISIWVDCPREIRLSRGLERDGEKARDMWENNWMVSEDIYVKEHKPYERADFIAVGTK
ncbi:uridine kinase family protein [Alicyclobacillus kakegawensis]|uniref:uridine kinase family protein n=1 Tax=Alicyclobacillus kakegawensis TaxID=392012 RepID=UPI00083750DA|nr:AAA family ATPase [Alicyclobacillus kakegawensis]